jgi:hypothetical protein
VEAFEGFVPVKVDIDMSSRWCIGSVLFWVWLSWEVLRLPGMSWQVLAGPGKGRHINTIV